MMEVVASTRARIETNERLLLATRHLLTVSRRLLYFPRLNIAGASGEVDGQSAVRRIVRMLLASGALWPVHGSVTWAGYGSGSACCVCAKPIKRSEVDYAVDDGGRQLPACHFVCFVVWYEESRTFNGYS